MIKKSILSLLLVLCLLLCGCAPQEIIQTPVTFYYRNAGFDHGTDTGVILGETRDAENHRDDIPRLLNTYLAGPKSENLLQVFPKSVRLVDYRVANDVAQLTLSDEIAQLEGLSLTIACACLTKTVMGLVEVRAVRIQSETLPLNNNLYIIMDSKTLLLVDTGQDTA